jgi:hypothetical protein
MSDNPEAVKNLGLEGIDDEQKRQQVEDFFKARTDLLAEIVSDKKIPKEVLQDKLKEYNRTQIQTQQIIDGIIQELQKDSLERDLNEGYKNADGEHESYIEQFHKEAERVGVDFEGEDKDRNNPVRQACLGEVVKAIRALPPNLKRSFRHQYVKDLISDYVKKMDDKAEWMKIGVLKMDDLKELKVKSIQEWTKEPGRPPEAEMMQKYDANQAKEFIQGAAKAKENLAKARQQSAPFATELKDYFEKGAKEIEGFMTDNPTGAAEAAQKLADESVAVAGLITLKGEIATKITETADAALKKRYSDLNAKIDANLKAMPAEKDPAKRKTLIDLPVLQGEKAGIDATTGGSAEAAPQATPEPDMMKDPGGWIKYQVNEFKKYINEIIGFITGIAGFFGAKSVAGAAGAAKPGAPGDAAENADAAKKEAASKFLKDKFKVSEDEFKKLLEVKLGDFLKMQTKPDWMDAQRFNALKSAVSANRTASDGDDLLLIDLVLARKENWKDVPVTQNPTAPAGTPPSAAPPASQAPAK